MHFAKTIYLVLDKNTITSRQSVFNIILAQENTWCVSFTGLLRENCLNVQVNSSGSICDPWGTPRGSILIIKLSLLESSSFTLSTGTAYKRRIHHCFCNIPRILRLSFEYRYCFRKDVYEKGNAMYDVYEQSMRQNRVLFNTSEMQRISKKCRVCK